jgi:O-antigen ligase
VWVNLPLKVYGIHHYKSMMSAGQFLSVAIMILSFCVFSPIKWKRWIFHTLFLLAILDAILVLFKIPGLFNASSMDACFLALMLPLFIYNRFYVASVLIAAAILFTKSATPIFMFVAYGFIVLWYWNKKLLWLSAVPILLGAIFLKEFLYYPADRLQVWGDVFPKWVSTFNIWLGSGSGTYKVLGPVFQTEGVTTSIFYFTHNEYLQIFFEQGLVGLVLGLWVTGRYFIRSTNPLSKISLSGFAVCSLTQYPFRFALTAFLFIYVIRLIIEEERILEDGI